MKHTLHYRRNLFLSLSSFGWISNYSCKCKSGHTTSQHKENDLTSRFNQAAQS